LPALRKNTISTVMLKGVGGWLGKAVRSSVVSANFYHFRHHIVTEDRNLEDELNVR